MMSRFKKLGVMVSIHDFGTGYSSFGYLKQFPIDFLKVDRIFIRDLARNPKDAAIVQAIAALAQPGYRPDRGGGGGSPPGRVPEDLLLHRDAGVAFRPRGAGRRVPEAGGADCSPGARPADGLARGRLRSEPDPSFLRRGTRRAAGHLQRLVRRAVGPAAQVAGHDVGKRVHPVVALVQARDVVKLAAAGVEELALALDRDLLERLQAVVTKPGQTTSTRPVLRFPSSASMSAV